MKVKTFILTFLMMTCPFLFGHISDGITLGGDLGASTQDGVSNTSTETVVLFSDDFNDGNLLDGGWELINADGDGYNWAIENGYIFSKSYYKGVGAFQPNDYIVTKNAYKISESSVLTFDAGPTSNYNNNTYHVVVSENGTEWNVVYTENFRTPVNSTAVEKKTVNLGETAYVGETVYIGFNHNYGHEDDGSGVKIDDVELTGVASTAVAKIGTQEFETFADALTVANGMTGDVTVDIYEKVTLEQSLSGSYSSIKFVGKDTDAEIYLNVQGYITATGKNVAFEDLTLSKSEGGFIDNAGFMNVAFGVYDVTEVTYTNCTFANGAYASSGNVTYTGCIFKRSHDKYGLWAYGNVDIAVDGCTFDDYRGIKMYAEGAAKTVDLTVKNTDFSAVDDKPAIVLTYGEKVTLQGNTYSSTGTFELDLDGAPNGTTVTSDVDPICKNDNGDCGVLCDGKIYTTVAQAAEVATSGSTVTLLHDSTETVELPVGVTLDNNGHTAENVTIAEPFADHIVLPSPLDENNYKTMFGVNTVTDGTNYYPTLQAAVEAVAGQANAILYCKPGADVGSLQHAPVTSTLTVYGNDASVSGNTERDFDLGNTDPSGGNDITADMTLTVKHLDGCGAWGAKATEHTVNLVFENCDNMGKVFITGTTGTLNITMTDCAFEGVIKEAVYSNADGAITLTEVAFSNLNKAVNLNHKAAGTQTVTIDKCTFTNCGANVADDQIPVRVLSSVEGGKTILSVENTTFTGTTEGGADILLANGVGLTDATIKTTAAKVQEGSSKEIESITVEDEYKYINAVAQIGETYYASLQAAINAVKDGETITLVDNVTISAATAGYTDGTYIDGVRYTGDKSFTVDFNGKTVTDDGCVNDYLIYINNKGEKASEITFTNGTIVSANGCWSAVCVNSSAATQNVELNLNGMNITNSNDADYSGNPVVRVRTLATVNVNDGTTITSNGASYGVAANTDGSTVNINEGATIIQQNSGTTGGNSVFAAVGGKGVINIKGGTITSDRYGVHTMTTGTPVINISGGTITAPVALKSSTNGGNGELATINVTGGTINGTLETYTDNGKIVVSGGTFSEAVAEEYCADGFVPVENADGTFGVVVDPAYGKVAMIGETYYETLQEAVNVGGEVKVIANITLDQTVKVEADKTVVLDLNGKTISTSAVETSYAINNHGTLTLKDSSEGKTGEVNARGIYNGYDEDGNHVATAKIIVESGTYNAKGANGDAAIFNYGIAEINGGTFTSVGSYSLNNREYAQMTIGSINRNATDNIEVEGGIYNTGAELTINKGDISNSRVGAHTVYAWDSEVSIIDGNIHNENSGNATIMAAGTSTVDIDGGTFTINIVDASSSYLLDAQNTASYDISGGEFTGGIRAQAGTNYNITGGTYTNEYGNYNVYTGGNIDIKGGTFVGNYAKTFAENNLADGYELNDDGTVSLLPVAQIGDVQYTSLQEAVNVGGEVKVIANITLTETVTILTENTVTLDLNGKTINAGWADQSAGKHIYAFTNNGTLTIKGEGTINARGNYNYGTMTLENGTINGIDVNGGYAICNYGGAIFTMKGGAINVYESDPSDPATSGNYDATALNNEGTAILEDGTITSTSNYVYAVQNTGSLTIKDGMTIKGRGGVSVTLSSATVTVEGGNIQNDEDNNSTGHAFYVEAGELIINGGNITATNDKNDGNSVVYVASSESAKATINGGKFITNEYTKTPYGPEGCNITIKGGTFDKVVEEKYLADGFICEQNADGTYGVVEGLAGEGTEENPYLIKSLTDLTFFRDQVNGGVNYYEGKYVALGANIDLAGENWVGIGTATADHGFMGNFDGKTYKIMNLTITDPALYSDGYAYAGLFGVTEGTDKDNQNTIKNLTIENVTISTDGHIAAAAVAYPYYTIIDKVKVCGDINITGGDYTAGALAYTRRCVDASNITVEGGENSYITGANVVGGVISDIQMNGGLTANYSNFEVSGVTITGTNMVGGISGIISSQTLNGATVRNVTLNSSDARVGIVAGCLGGTSTISNVTYENVTGATAVVGATYDGGEAVEAKIGDTYYATLQTAIAAVQNDETITLLIDTELSEMITIPNGKTVVLDLNGKTITGTDNTTKNFSIIDNRGNLTITDSSDPSTGKITLTATTNSGWNRYSAVIANNPGGKLTIEAGTLEHLGGTDMAYGIDNLTNGKGTYAETVINGGTIKSTYRGIRQFLNGIEAQNILTVNGGTIEGANKSIWMQDPSVNANTGTLTVGEEANLIGNVYLYVTPNSTSWPVEVSIAAAALAEGSEVMTANLPVGVDVQNINGTYGNVNVVAQIGETKYQSLAAAATAAQDGETIQLIWAEGNDPISMAATFVGNKTVTITGTANVNWSKGWFFVGRGGEGNGHVIFDNANLTSTSVGSNSGFGLNVSCKKEGESTTNDGEVEIINSNIQLDYLIGKGNIKLNNSTLNVYEGFAVGARPASETSGEQRTVTMDITNGSNVIVKNHNGQGLGYESKGIMNIDATSTFKTTQSFLVTADGTMNNAGTVEITGTLTNNGTINFTDLAAKLTAQEGLTIVDKVNDPDYAIAYLDGTYQYAKYVAQIGEAKYLTLQEAFNAAQDGDEIVVLKDIVLTEGITVAADDNMTLDLNGKTISRNTETATSTAAITNNGNLTIKDSSDPSTGKITAFAANPDTQAVPYYASNTITNCGVLTVLGGTIENSTGDEARAAFPIDNNSTSRDAIVTIEGGKVTGRGAIRQFANSTTHKNEVNVKGGEVFGSSYAIWVQNPGSGDPKAALNIEDGTLSKILISPSANFEVAISGGTLTEVAIWEADETDPERNPSNFINGGTFSNEVPAEFLAPGCVLEPNADGTYSVVEDQVAKIGDVTYKLLHEAFDAAQDGDEIVVLKDIVLTEGITVAADKTVALDLNGKTITGTPAEAKAFAVITNKGNLTITDGTETEGKIVCDHKLAGSTGYAVNTITNSGTLTIVASTIQNTSTASNQIGYAIDNNSTTGNTILVIEGDSKVTASGSGYYDGIRQFCNSETNENSVTIKGGEVSSLWLQNPSDGSGTQNTKDVKGSFAINGGTLNNLYLEPSTQFAGAITGGHVGNISRFQTAEGRDLEGFITGGTFSVDPTAYCAEGYSAKDNGDGTYSVIMTSGTQEIALALGWNWFSSYIDLSGETGLEKVQTALGTNGVQIKGKFNNNSSSYQDLGNGTSAWIGDFDLSTKQMYMINTSADVTMKITGNVVDREETTISLGAGWNWISYPLYETVDINEALANHNTAADGDAIKTLDKTSVYYSTLDKWIGDLTELTPGQGYMYKSANATSFVYSAGSSRSAKSDAVSENKFWKSNANKFANNMTIVAMLSIDGEIVNDNYEIAAFANGECRGSARPVYVEELDQHILFLTINGEDVQELTFKYYDVNYGTVYELNNRINYSNDAVLGSIDEPYMFNLGILNIEEATLSDINIYPNPTTTGKEINLEATCDKVEVFNALGVKVAEYSNVDSIDALETAGIYVIRVTIDGDARNCRLVVK